MKLRYYNINNPGTKYTREIAEGGTLTDQYRLAAEINGKLLIKEDLKEYILQPLFPDVPLNIILPAQITPSFHWEYHTVQEIQENGSVVIKSVAEKVWDVTVEQSDALRAQFETLLRQYLSIVRLVLYPIIPDGPDWRWEEYHPELPIRYRWQSIPVEVGKYPGPKWKLTSNDVYAYFVDYLSSTTNLVKGITERQLTII